MNNSPLIDRGRENYNQVKMINVFFQAYRESVRGGERGWADLYSSPSYHPKRQEFVVIAPIMDGEHGQYRHIMRVR